MFKVAPVDGNVNNICSNGLTKKCKTERVKKIKIGNNVLTEPNLIAESFNEFSVILEPSCLIIYLYL